MKKYRDFTDLMKLRIITKIEARNKNVERVMYAPESKETKIDCSD